MYFASEIEPNAIKVAQSNNPIIVEIGDVSKISYKDGVLYTPNKSYNIGHIDLICGGSPCTNFSSIIKLSIVENVLYIIPIDAFAASDNLRAVK
jgi:site-specific DNA-cytosine methylase